MTNTTPNVPRELLERASNLAFQTQHYPLHEELRALLSSPAYTGEDGLEADCKTCNGHGLIGDAPIECPDCCADDAQAIIDGLRGEVARYRAVLDGAKYPSLDKLLSFSVEDCRFLGETVASMTISAQSERDQQAQRIGELEQILRDLVPGCKWRFMRPRIDSALSAGKDAAP